MFGPLQTMPSFRRPHTRIAAAGVVAAAAITGILTSAASPSPAPAHPAVTVTPHHVNITKSHVSTTAVRRDDARTKPARPAKSAQPVKSAKSAQPAKRPSPKPSTYLLYDSTRPWALPAHKATAVYSNGAYRSSGPVSHDQVQLWIDVNASDPSSDVLDVEPGDARPSSVATWVRNRITRYAWATPIIYTMRAEWEAAKASVRTLPSSMQSRVRWWIADPTGHPHLVPGSSATQWYWGTNYDISTASSELTTLIGS